MFGQGNTVTKFHRRHHNDPPSSDKVVKHPEKSLWHKYAGKPPHSKSKNTEANRFEMPADSNSMTEHSRKSQLSSTNVDDTTGKDNETDTFETVGGTLADGIKSMKMFPVLNSYQEIDASNRSYLWKVYLENLDGEYVIIDKAKVNDDLSAEVYEKNVIRKVEISTLIHSDSELYATTLDSDNQTTIALDIDRTRNTIKMYKTKAEKMLTLFCKAHNIRYKQGLNEVISMFLL